MVEPTPLTFSTTTHRLQKLDALREVSHEGESADALAQTWDLSKAHHEAVLLGQLVQGPAIALVVLDELEVVLRGDETLQKLKEVQAESFLVIAVDV